MKRKLLALAYSFMIGMIVSSLAFGGTVFSQIQFRRGTAAQWTAADNVLAQGEPGYETDTGRMKIGTGLLHWSVLPYWVDNQVALLFLDNTLSLGKLNATGVRDNTTFLRGDNTFATPSVFGNGAFTGTVSANEIITRDGPYLDVRAYRLPGDTDNTAQIQRAIDNAGIGDRIYFPPGVYTVSSTITLTDKQNITLEAGNTGRGQGGVWIRWAGAGDNTATMFDMAGTQRCIFRGIGFIGNSDSVSTHRTNIGVYMHRGSIAGSANTFEHCEWAYFNVGTQVGHLTTNESNNEDHTFSACTWVLNGIGYRQYWANAIGITFYSCGITSSDNGVVLGSATGNTGSVNFYWLNIGHNTTDVYIGSGVYALGFYGVRSEVSGKFLDGPSVTAGQPVTIINGTFDVLTGYATQPYINALGIAAVNCAFGGSTGSDNVQIRTTILNGTSTYTNCAFNNPNIFNYADNNIQSTKVSMVGCRAWDWTTATYRPISDGQRFAQTASSIYKLPAADNTPRVDRGDYYYTGANTSVSTFRGSGALGQRITVQCTDNTATIVNGASIKLSGATNFVCAANAILSLIMGDNGVWYETGRSVN